MSKASDIHTAQTFRASMVERIFVTVCALFMGLVALFMLVAAVGGFVANFFLGLFILAVAMVVIALTWLVAKEAFSRWRLYAHLGDGVLTAMLPRRRGFIDQPRLRVTIALADIDRIETRYECFTSIGVTTGQRAYSLVKGDGERLLLGADREWVPPFFGRLTGAIVDRTNIPVTDLGMVDGDAGFMLVTRQSAPGWDAPPLAPAEVETRQRRRASTVAVLGLVVMLVVLAQVLSRG